MAALDVRQLYGREMKLEQLTPNTSVRGITPDASVTVVSVEWHGSDAVTLFYRAADGRVGNEVLYREDEARLSVVDVGCV